MEGGILWGEKGSSKKRLQSKGSRTDTNQKERGLRAKVSRT